MFRELARKKKQISTDECICLLRNEKRGVLSVLGDDDYPYGMPMNHFYNDDDGCLYFHCGKAGHRLDSLKSHEKVSYCVYDKGYCGKDEWALNIKSVIVFGKTKIIYDTDKIIDITAKLSHKFTQDEEYINEEIKKYAHNTLLIQLVPEHICGKLVTES